MKYVNQVANFIPFDAYIDYEDIDDVWIIEGVCHALDTCEPFLGKEAAIWSELILDTSTLHLKFDRILKATLKGNLEDKDLVIPETVEKVCEFAQRLIDDASTETLVNWGINAPEEEEI